MSPAVVAGPPPYSPSLAPPEILDACTVGHDRLLETVVKGLRTTIEDGGARFELLVGPAGSGKTHLLRSIYRRLRASRGASKAALLLLDERAVLGSVSDLMARAIEALGDGEEDSALRLARRLEPADAADLLETRLAEKLAGRPLLLFVEELGDLLEAGGADEQHRLRAALQNRASWSLITTGLRPSPVFTSAAAPLFGTFALRTVPPLSAALGHELRLRRGEGAEPTMAGSRALHHLLGGWPRPLVLAQQLTTRRESDLGELAVALGDRLEPELGCIERHLPRGRGSVLQAIVSHVRPLSPSVLAADLYGVSPSAVTAQLKILRDDGVVVAHRVGRSSYYELANPSHHLVAARRAQPERLATLARFLGSWYADAEDDGKATMALGGRRAASPGDSLLSLDLSKMAGLDPATVEAVRRVLTLRAEASPDLPAALTEAAHAYAQSSPAERLLLDQCLAGLGLEALLATQVR